MKQNVVQGLTTHARRGNEYLEVLDNLFLPGEIAETLGTQRFLKVLVVAHPFIAYVKIVFHFSLQK